MAKRANKSGNSGNGEDTPTTGHNRHEVIRDTMRRISALEDERKAISEDIRGIKNTVIKGQLGMKIGDFNTAMRLYSLEGDDRDQMLDTIRETFDALGVGDQLDWVQISTRAQAAETAPEGAESAGEEEAAAAEGSVIQ